MSNQEPKIEVRKAKYDCPCCITQKSIEEGEIALQLGEDPPTWVSRKGIRKMYELFSDSMEIKDKDLRRMLLDLDFKSATGTCVICDEQNQTENAVFVIGLFSQLWVHEDCTDDFAELIKTEVEQNTEKFL